MYMDSNDKNNSIYMDNKNKEDIELFLDHIFYMPFVLAYSYSSLIRDILP